MLSEACKKKIQGAYSEFLENRQLKARFGQKLMIAEIAKTLGAIELDGENIRENSGHICVVEAGTGTGKTIAYLLPAIIMAKALGKKLVVSTATIALQEQIVNKDLPELLRNTSLSFNFSLAKGRSRYLCLSKLDNILSESSGAVDPRQALYEDELPSVDATGVKIYQTMMEALAANTWDGEKDSWQGNLAPEDWQRVTTDHRQCTGRRCSNVSACSFFKARDSLHSTDCIVTNHDLVLADLALGGGAILPAPEDTIYVFDEGHHLPEKSLNHFAHHSRVMSTSRWLDQCNKSLSTILSHVGSAGSVASFAERLPALLSECKLQLDKVYPVLDEKIQSIDIGYNGQRNHYRFDNGVIPDALKIQAIELYRSFDRLASVLTKISNELTEAMEDAYCPVPKIDLENHFPIIGAWQARAEGCLRLWATFAQPDAVSDVPSARWLTIVEVGGGIDIEVCSSPILAANTLEKTLWSSCCGAIVTSATLTALGKFDRYCMRAGTPIDSQYKVVPSPFDFSKATLQVPNYTVEANDSERHTQSLVEKLPVLLSEKEGTLVLFSSRRQMNDVYELLPKAQQDIILVQGESSKQALLSLHKERIDKGARSALFGLASFSEGVDLPGKYCGHVIVAKLPFAVPDDPIEASVSEWIESRGGNAFMEITVPDASLKLIQACGRLLRTETDSGLITLLDRRVVTKRYGKAILQALPSFAQDLLG